MGHGHHHHNHDHSHGHHHDHNHEKADYNTHLGQLKKVLILTSVFMVIEVIGGLYTNSLALLSDSAHMFTDLAALLLSMFAFFMSSLPASDSRTFGFYRLEILAAFVNGMFLVALSFGLIYSSWQRYQSPTDIKSVEMFFISFGGLVVNLIGAWILSHGGHDNPNMKAALFHILGDALGSLGAMIAAALVHYYGWLQADPIVSSIISIIIIVSAIRLIWDTGHVIIEGTPHHLNMDEIRESISSVSGVDEVHDLHVWSITAGMVSLSVHVVSKIQTTQSLLNEIRNLLKSKFHIEHVTIQIENESLKAQEPPI